VEKNNNNIPLS
jgi:hypothetical protein